MQKVPIPAADHRRQQLQPSATIFQAYLIDGNWNFMLLDPIHAARGRVHQLSQQVPAAIAVAFLSLKHTSL